MRVRRKFTTRLLASVLSLAVAQAVAVTTITTGSFLVISEPATFASGAITFAGSGTIVFTGSGVLGNDVVLFPGVLGTFNTNGQNDTLAGLLTGQGMLVKQGGGVLTLPGANSFAGGTSVVAGTLAVGSNTALGSGMLSINGGGLLANKDVLLANRLSLGDSFTIAAATGTTLAVGAGGWGIADAADMTIGSSNATGTVVWATPAGSGGHANINVAGGTLKGADSLFGKLLLNAAASLRVASGATLDLGGSGAILPAALSGDGRITSSSGAPTLRLNGGSFGGTIDGALALEVDGQTVLSGTSTHTGGTSIGPGATLQLGDGGAGGSIGGNVQNHGTLTVNRSDDMLFGGLISGSGRLVKLGAGSLALPVANTFSGGSTLAAGTLALGSGAALGSGLLTITGGTLLATKDMTPGNRLDLSGSFTIAAATGTTFAVGGGGWSMAGNTSMVIGGVVSTGTVLWASQGGSITSPGPAITLAGGTFRGADSTSVDVLLRNAGSLQIGAFAALDLGGYDATLPEVLSGSGRITSGKGAPTLNLMGGDFGGSIDGALALNVAGRATLSGANTYTGGTTIGRFAVLQLGNGGLGGSIDGDIQVLESGDLSVFQTSDLVIGSAISGAGSLVKQGIGKLTLRGPNTFSGGVLMQNGTLAVDNDMALGTGLLIVRGGTLLGIANAVLGNVFVGANAFTIAAAAGTTLSVGGPGSVLRQSTTIEPTSMNIGSKDATGTVQWAPGFTASPVRDSRSEINVVSGTFKGADAGLGLLMGQAGTLRVFDGATLDLGGFNADLPSQLMGRGRITSSSGAPTLGVSGGDFGGTIDSKLALQVSGLKTILRGANSYVGGTTINGGATLQLGNFSELDDFSNTGSGVAGGSIIGSVLNNGTLIVNQHGNLLLDGAISGDGALVKSGSGVLALTGNNSFSGGVTLGGGTLAVNNGMAVGTGRLTISGRALQGIVPTLLLGTANATLDNLLVLRSRVTIAAAADTTLALGNGVWIIDDNTELTIGTVNAPGTVLWSSPPGSSGSASIHVAAGTFKGADAGFGTRLLANAVSVQVAAGATLDLGGINASLPAALSGQGRIISSSGTPVLGVNGGSFGGSIEGALALEVAGLTTLTGASTYTGGTTIASGATLQLGNGGAGGSIAGDVIANGKLMVNQGGDLLLNGVISGNGALVKRGIGTLTLGGASTFGSVAVDTGSLRLLGTSRVSGAVVNAGGIAAQGLVTIGGSLDNSGSIDFSGGNTVVTGKLTNNAGATLQVSQVAAFNGDVVNNGTLKTVAATVTFRGGFTNNGAYVSDPSTQSFQDITLGAQGSLQGGAGDVFVINGDMVNNSKANGNFNLDAARLVFSSGAHSLTWSAANRGASAAGYDRNFAIGSFEVAAGGSLMLGGVSPNADANALYVREFVLDGGLAQLSRIRSNGLSIYYDPKLAANAYLSGKDYALDGAGSLMAVALAAAPVPEPRTHAMLLTGLVLMRLVARRRRPDAA